MDARDTLGRVGSGRHNRTMLGFPRDHDFSAVVGLLLI
jgi:hypothetical protein